MILLVCAFFLGSFLLVAACASSVLGNTVFGIIIALLFVFGMFRSLVKGE